MLGQHPNTFNSLCNLSNPPTLPSLVCTSKDDIDSKEKLPCVYEYAHPVHPLGDTSELSKNTNNTIRN
ncbi:hypothetical protein Hanom_Chr08g00693341 [Helianthus anomalus]